MRTAAITGLIFFLSALYVTIWAIEKKIEKEIQELEDQDE